MGYKHLIALVQKSDFARNALTLISGTTLAQVINFVLAPVLARLYSPEAFGELATFMALTSIIGVMSSFRYEMAIVLPKEDSEAYSITIISIIFLSLISLITLLCVSIFLNFSAPLIRFNQSTSIYYLLPVSVFLTGFIQVFSYWSVRLKRFKRNALARVGNAAGNTGTGILIGIILHGGGVGLILAFIASLVANLYILIYREIYVFLAKWKEFSIKEGLALIKKYRKYPLINTPHSIIGALKNNGIVLIIKELYGNHILGSYSFAYRIIGIPTSVISSSISQVFFQKASQLRNENKPIRPLLLKIYSLSFIIGLPVFGTLYFFAPQLFSFLFSEKYYFAGEVATYLIPWIFINFVAASASFIPLVFNQLFIPLLFTIGDIILQVAAIAIGWFYNDYVLSFKLMGLLCFINTTISFFWIYRIAKT